MNTTKISKWTSDTITNSLIRLMIAMWPIDALAGFGSEYLESIYYWVTEFFFLLVIARCIMIACNKLEPSTDIRFTKYTSFLLGIPYAAILTALIYSTFPAQEGSHDIIVASYAVAALVTVCIVIAAIKDFSTKKQPR